MAITFNSNTYWATGTRNTDFTATEPSGTVEGDFLLAFYIFANGYSATGDLPSSGWTEIYSGLANASGSGGFYYRVGYCIRGASAPGLTFQLEASSAVYYECQILGWHGDSLELDAQSSDGGVRWAATVNDNNPNPPAVVAVAESTVAITFGANWIGSASSWGAPTNYTIRSQNSPAGIDLVIASRTLSASGSENPDAFTGSSSYTRSDVWDGATVTIAEAGEDSAALTLPNGSISENDVKNGGKTIRITLTGDTFVPESVDTQIAFVGGQYGARAGSNSSTNVNFALSGGLASTPAAGDLVIIGVSVGSQGRTPSCAVSGYTALGLLSATTVTYDSNLDVSRKFMGGTPDTQFTIPSSGSTADGQAWVVLVFRNVDPNTPLDVTSQSATGTATGRPNPAAITPSSAGAWILVFGSGAAATGADYVAPSGFTTNFQTDTGVDTNDGMAGGGYYTGWSSGQYDPAAFTGGTTGANDSWCAYTLALRPGPDTTPFADARASFRTNLDSDGSEGTGWDARKSTFLPLNNIVRTSNTQLTATLAADSGYDITADETITSTVPAAILTGGVQLVATPTFTISSGPSAQNINAGANTVTTTAPTGSLSLGNPLPQAGVNVVTFTLPTVSILQGWLLAAGVNAVTITAPDATIGQGQSLSAGNQTITITTPTASVTTGGVNVTATNNAVTITAPDVGLTRVTTIQAGTQTINITNPIVSLGLVASIASGVQIVTITTPVVSLTTGGVNITTETNVVTVTNPTATLNIGGTNANLDAGVNIVTTTLPNASIALGGVSLVAGIQTVTISNFTASVSLGGTNISAETQLVTVTAPIATLQVAANNQNIEAGINTVTVSNFAATLALVTSVSAGQNVVTFTNPVISLDRTTQIAVLTNTVVCSAPVAGYSLGDTQIAAGQNVINLIAPYAYVDIPGSGGTEQSPRPTRNRYGKRVDWKEKT